MSGVTTHGIRHPDGASPAKNLGPELAQFAEDVDSFVMSKIGSGWLYRGDLPTDTDLNSFGGRNHTGFWKIGSTGHTNGPPITAAGILEVIRLASDLAVVQRVVTQTSMWWREAIDYGVGSWGSWKRVATADEVPVRGQLPDGADLNTYRLGAQAGSYAIASTATYLNAPPIDYGGVFELVTGTGSNYSALQRITTQGSMWWREAIDHGIGTWGSWKRLATLDDVMAGGGDGVNQATIVYSESATGAVTYSHGDVDHLMANGVASITKMFTVWTARQHLTDAELDGTAVVQAGDMSDSPHLKVGDVVKLRDLGYASMVSSDSTAPNVLARVIGAKIDPLSPTPRAVFLSEMEAEAARLGYSGAKFPMAISGARVSARHVVDMFRRFRADAQLRPMPAALTHSFPVTGSDPRTINIGHTINPNGAVPLPEFQAGKTGTTSGRAHVVVEWRHPDGTDHITAVLNTLESSPNQRYIDLRTVIDTAGSETRSLLGVVNPRVLGRLQYPGEQSADVPRVVTNDEIAGIDGNIYGVDYRTPSGFGVVQGSRTSPVPDARPVFWVQKFSSANRAGSNPKEWDQGAYFGVEKRAGDAFVAALTGYVRHDSVDGGDAIGVHGRSAAYQANSESWGGWFYAAAANPDIVPQSIIGVEINLNSKNADQGYSPATGYSKGLLVVTQDGSQPVTIGVEVGRGTAAPNGHFHTGIKIRRDSVLPAAANTATGVTDNEAVLIEGATAIANAAHGIRLGYGNYRSGLSLAEGTFANNAAILLGEAHRIVVGPGAGVSSYVEFSRTNSFMNLNNLGLRINGVPVLGQRKTGWAAPTGTATRTSFATSTATVTQVAERLKALIDDLTLHGLIGA